jgi:hypothetical protein
MVAGVRSQKNLEDLQCAGYLMKMGTFEQLSVRINAADATQLK